MKRVLALGLGVIAAGLLAACTPVHGLAPKPVFHNPPTVSLSEYDRITNGLNLHQVQSLIGSQGSVESDFRYDGYWSRTLSWPGADDYSSAWVTFDNGLVSGKFEYGLK